MAWRALLTTSLAAALVAAAGSAHAALPAHAAVTSPAAHLTLVDHRDGRGRGDRGYDRHGRGGGSHYGRHGYRPDYRPAYRPYYPRYRAPRYVYAPPAYYYAYDDYYYGYPPGGYFSFSSPNLGFSLGY